MPDTLPEAANDRHGKSSIHSFIVRIWLEEFDAQKDQEIWRGHITHVPGDQRQYFTDLDEIPALIASHLRDQE